MSLKLSKIDQSGHTGRKKWQFVFGKTRRNKTETKTRTNKNGEKQKEELSKKIELVRFFGLIDPCNQEADAFCLNKKIETFDQKKPLCTSILFL